MAEHMMEPQAGMAAPVMEARAPDGSFAADRDALAQIETAHPMDAPQEETAFAKNAKVGSHDPMEFASGAAGGAKHPPDGSGSPGEGPAQSSAEEGTAKKGPSESRRPLLIYQADLGLGVFRVQENLDKIEKMALGVGGYLVTRSEQSITVRVPAGDFESTVEAVLKLGDVHRRQIVAQDVTAEFSDLQIRLKNALAVRERLQELLQKAQDVKEALKVEEELGRVAEQIELLKGRLKYLHEVTSFSTVSVEFSERSAPIDARVELPFGWLRELGLNSLLRL